MHHRIHTLTRDRFNQWTAVCTCGWVSGLSDSPQEAEEDGTHHLAENNPQQLKLKDIDNGYQQ